MCFFLGTHCGGRRCALPPAPPHPLLFFNRLPLLPTLFRFYSYVFPFVFFFDPPFPQFLDDFHYDRPYLFFLILICFFLILICFFLIPRFCFFLILICFFWSLSQTWSSWYFYGISIRYFHKIFDISMVYLIYVGVYVYIYMYIHWLDIFIYLW